MLNAELDAHLDNEKHDKTKDGNYRNGHTSKKIKTSFGEEQIQEMYGFEVSTSTISRITNAVTNEMVAWQNRLLDERF